MKFSVLFLALPLAFGLISWGEAHADCAIFGDSIGVGLGHAMFDQCPTTAEIGILSSVVASRVTPGARWTIVSLGSNDFPDGISPEMQALSETRIKRALSHILEIVGRRLILILPANGARVTVRDWALAREIDMVSFEPGPDGIHPRNAAYAAMARTVSAKIDD